jgi:uncharacterized membrane protein YesL
LWVAVTFILLSPALAAADAVFHDYSVNASVTPFRTYARAWWHAWPRVVLPGLAITAFLFIVGVDFYAVTLWGYGTLVLPLTVILAAAALITMAVSWVGLTERPDLTRRAVVKASLYLAVRKFGWSLLSLVVLAAVAAITYSHPAIGLGLLSGPALYVVWGNSRRTLTDLLPEDHQVVDEDLPANRRITRGRS